MSRFIFFHVMKPNNMKKKPKITAINPKAIDVRSATINKATSRRIMKWTNWFVVTESSPLGIILLLFISNPRKVRPNLHQKDQLK